MPRRLLFLAGISLVGKPRFPKWLDAVGAAFACLFAVGAFRNVGPAVQPLAELNNALLALWMIVQGAALVWYTRSVRSVAHE
ncbi:MAG: hypothetical protein ABI699_07365 [Caldimonas sp.]